jgi:hypothetical protein
MLRQIISSSARAISGSIVVVLLTAAAAAGQAGSAAPQSCQPVGPLVRVPELPEGSGVAASRRSPGRLWAHNDSGEPVLVALDPKGAVVGRVRVSGARVEDWEAVAVGPCPAGSCIYIGDIGDNDAERRSVTIYRVPEPADASGSARVADLFQATYPDGAHDSEALLVTPKGEILIVTKGDKGSVALYRVPSDARPGETVILQPIGEPRELGRPAGDERITDGTVSPNGAWVALRTNAVLFLYRTDDLVSGSWRESSRVSLRAFGEPQGEGVAFGDERTIYLVGEGGGKAQPGTFGRLACTF